MLYVLRTEVAQSQTVIVISQRKYVFHILEETRMLDCKPIDTPMNPDVKPLQNQGVKESHIG